MPLVGCQLPTMVPNVTNQNPLPKTREVYTVKKKKKKIALLINAL